MQFYKKATRMGQYIEYGLGQASRKSAYDMGFLSAKQALAQIERFLPSLAIAFVPPTIDAAAAHKGLVDALEGCPLIGTSTAGEILNTALEDTVVIAVIASPYVKAHIGFGKDVAADYSRSVQDALESAEVEDYFNRKHYLNQMLNLTAPGNPSPPLCMILFTPGATRSQISLSHEIHTLIRKKSGNRIPIIGGSSADYFQYEQNFQIANQEMNTNSIAIALIESELLFGMGMSHGFTRTDQQAVITKASGHYVYELDREPAAQRLSQLLNLPCESLDNGRTPLTNYPFGVSDVYGNSLLMVPEMTLPDLSIQFAPIMKNNQVLTLMKEDPELMQDSCRRAFQKAVHQGGLQKPELCLVFACGLRKKLPRHYAPSEIDVFRKDVKVPITGFYTFGEQGLSDDGFPIYSNQSISMLVFADELNPVTDLIHRRKKIYSEYNLQLQNKINQIEAINAIGKLITECTSYDSLLPTLVRKMKELIPLAESAFYLTTNEADNAYSIASSSNFEVFPHMISDAGLDKECIRVLLESDIKRFGMLIIKPKNLFSRLTEDDVLLTNIIGQITSGALHKIEINQQLENKLQQIEILNQFGEKLAKSMETDEKYQSILKNIRNILEVNMVSLWFVDENQNIIINEAMDAEEHLYPGELEIRVDNQISRWQIKNRQPVFSVIGARKICPIDIDPSFELNFVSLPIMYKRTLQGVLNIYSKLNYKWYFQRDAMTESIEFLSGFSGMLAIFIENRSLYQHKTFNMEIHHRVKNNLQTIASLLRMQARRLNEEGTQEAFLDSISRVMSIAKVHEMLSLKQVESVEIGDLISNISNLAQSETPNKPFITLDISNPEILLPSKQATSLALVLNELIQNAVKYGYDGTKESMVLIKAGHEKNTMEISVQDNGPGVSRDFDLKRDKHLGLTIVSTIVSSELKGRFSLESSNGTKTTIQFPIPVIQQLKKLGETHDV